MTVLMVINIWYINSIFTHYELYVMYNCQYFLLICLILRLLDIEV